MQSVPPLDLSLITGASRMHPIRPDFLAEVEGTVLIDPVYFDARDEN